MTSTSASRNRRSNLRSTGRGIAFLVLILGLACDCVMGAEPRQAGQPSGRYLLIVDASSSMRRSAENMEAFVQRLLLLDMYGQLRPGDTIGVWTFNERLSTGQLPLQLWTPEARRLVATNIVNYLAGLRFEKRSRLDSVMPDLLQLIRESEKITVILLTSGDSEIRGSPCDDSINRVFEAGRSDLRKARQPFVIVMRTRRGIPVGCSVSWAPWPVEFPAFPVEPALSPKEKQESESKSASLPPETANQPHVAAKPLIVIGNKVESPATETGGQKQTEAIVPPVVSAPGEAAVQPPVQAGKPEPAPTLAIAAPARQPPAAPEPEVRPSVPAPTPLPIAIEEPKVEGAEKPVQVSTGSQPATTSAAQSPSPPQEESAPPSSERARHLADSAIQAAVTTPAPSAGRRLYLFGGLAALVLGLGLGFVLMRKPRSAAGSSLITRSMDRRKK